MVRDSEPSPGHDDALAALLDELHQLWQRCQQPIWDGEGADAITAETHAVAKRMLESLPDRVRLPCVSAEPNGHLNFEWHVAPQRMLTASITANGTVYWAALVGSEAPRGSCQFVDQFPRTLLYWIEQGYE